MKKTFLVVALIFTVILMACGNNTGPDSQSDNETNLKEISQEPLDLSGNWVQKGKEFDDSYLAGYIKGDRIEVFWMSDSGNTSALYWSGTYERPEEATKEYKWESNNYKSQTDMALLASGADRKSFTYKNAEISFEVSAMGQTSTVVFVITGTDYMKLGNVMESAATSNLESIELIDSGYGTSHSNGRTTVYYAVNVVNPNQEYAIEFPRILITAKDAGGKILKTEEMVLNGIAAGDRYLYGNNISYEGEVPATVDISVSNRDNAYIAQSSSDIVSSDSFSISNISENIRTNGRSYTGEVQNNNTEDHTIAIILIYKSGNSIIGGEVSYVDDLKSGSTKPFEINIHSDFVDYDSYEIHAIQWG